MKKLLQKLEDAFAAVSFAEAGEFETAKEIAHGEQAPKPEAPSPK